MCYKHMFYPKTDLKRANSIGCYPIELGLKRPKSWYLTASVNE